MTRMRKISRFDKSILRRFLCRAILVVGFKVDRSIRAILERFRAILEGVHYAILASSKISLDLVGRI